MFHKILIGFLAVTLIGAAGVGLIDAARPVDSTLNLTPTAAAVLENSAPEAAALSAEQATAVSAEAQVAGAADGSGPVAQQAATDMVGVAWHGAGEIVGIDASGFDLATGDVTSVYVELGQPSYWQAQGVSLAVGDFVTVDGFDNGDQIHAGTVTTGSGALLMVRTADGQPLWSGGASAQGQNGNAGTGTGTATGDVQVAAEDWVTIEGTITALDTTNVSLLTRAGEMMTFQLGQPSFWQSQGVTLNAWETVAVLGFWQDGVFQVGEVQKLATGERIMLRDPNGRPLWGGPGRAGGGSGGNGGNGAGGAATGSNGTGAGAQGTGGQGNGGQGADTQGNGGQGGRQYRGGRA